MRMESLYDNDWAYSYGIDLLYDPQVDDNLRAAWTYSDGFGKPDDPHKRRVRFDPKADGITDYEYRDYSDWGTMHGGICAPLQAERASAEQVRCPAVW